ncbi:MAG: TolC family protein [Candidatus Cloacimonetes bacterium]|nr:TolC family protein [Candidatus Cloacimonadota bacterium]
MKCLKLIFLLLVEIFFISTMLISQTINMEDFINQLEETHPIFEKEKLTTQIEKEEKNSYLGNQDWNFHSSVNLSHEEPAFAFGEPEKTDAFYVSAGVERLFWRTGGRFSTTFTSNLANIDPNFGYPDPFYQNQIDITYTHPLMKNRNGLLDKLQYELKDYDIDFSKVQSKENLELFIVSSADKFLDWVFLTEHKKIINERLRLSEEELSRTQKKREANLVDQADVIRAEDAVLFWKQNLFMIESQWKALQAELSVLLQNEEIINLEPEFKLYEYKHLGSLDDNMEKLKEFSRVMKIIKIRIGQLELARLGIEEISKPYLAFVAQGNLKNLDEKFTKSLVLDEPDISVGLQFSVPLENRTPKYQIKKTDLQISQLNKQLDDVTITMSSALTNLYIQINELENVLILNQEQIESTKERTKEEMKLYNQGRGDLTFVIMSRDNEQNAKLTYAQNSLMYHKLMLQYKALMDQIYE